MIDDDSIEKTNDWIRDNARAYAEAKSNRIYLEHFRKSKKAILFSESPAGTVESKNSYAYAHAEYIELLHGIREAVAQEEKLRWMMVAAEHRIEMWRTQQANNRRGI